MWLSKGRIDQMSLAEIIEGLPELTPEERRTIYQQIVS